MFARSLVTVTLLLLVSARSEPVSAFLIARSNLLTWNQSSSPRMPSLLANKNVWRLHNNRFDREFDEIADRRALRKAASSGAGETAAGAILGGLVLGPFGALFGASIGANFGASRALDKAKKEELARMGLTPEMLKMAQDIGVALDRGVEGLQATRESLESQKRYARRLDEAASKLYEMAKQALTANNDDRARELLMQRQQTQDRLKQVLLDCAEEKKRVHKMEQNVESLEERAVEVESLLRRNVGAKALQDSSNMLSLPEEDPLLKKFRDLGLD